MSIGSGAPRSRSFLSTKSVIVEPANGTLFIAVATTYPFKIGTTCVIPSPESMTVPVRSAVENDMLDVSISGVPYVP